MAVMQELSDRDMANHSMVVEHLTGILSDDVIILMTDEAHFQLSGCVNEQNFHHSERKIHSGSINGHFTVHV
jgi:hypothetical protein